MTSVTSILNHKIYFLGYRYLKFYCSEYVKNLTTVGAWFKLQICLTNTNILP